MDLSFSITGFIRHASIHKLDSMMRNCKRVMNHQRSGQLRKVMALSIYNRCHAEMTKRTNQVPSEAIAAQLNLNQLQIQFEQ